MFKLALDAGHGKQTAGKRCSAALDKNETREWVLNSRICEKVEKLLSDYNGVSVLRVDDRTGNTDTILAKRAAAANSFSADLYLSIHHNAGIKGGTGGGIVAYVYPSVDNATLTWQKEFYNAAIGATALSGNRKTPLAKKDLYVLRKTAMPAVLLECGFMDSQTDVPVILSDYFASQMAKAIVSVIAKRACLTKKEVPKDTSVYFPKYNGIGFSIVNGLKAVGAESSYLYRRKIAEKNGIADYSGTAAQNLALLSLLKKGVLKRP